MEASMEERETAVGAIAKSIASPAKLAFAGYVVLGALGKITVNSCQFFIVAGIFFAAQVVHDDYLRLKLNKWGES
jgi:hypothetical protein